MSLMTIHPRLYTTLAPHPSSHVVVSHGDSSVDTLYSLYLSRTVNTAGWAFRSTVMEQALRVFGNFQDWLEHQRANPSLKGHNREFVEDTIRYIQTGVRRMSVLNWIELMDEVGERDHPKVGDVSTLSSSRANTIQVLQAWCSHTDGIEDLVQTLYVLFGHKHRPN